MPASNVLVDVLTADKLEKLLKRHVKFLTEIQHPVRFIADAVFEAENGGILVSPKGMEDAIDAFLRNDPWIKSGCFKADLKILWIAKGTFCEK